MTIKYLSTRGNAQTYDLREAALGGLAPAGGLFVPEAWPDLSKTIASLSPDMSYETIAEKWMRPFTEFSFSDAILSQLVNKAASAFRANDITPLTKLDSRLTLLELFHGPSFAFKDVALQFLARCFDYWLNLSGERLMIIGATSGDTGSAAIMAFANSPATDVFILYPKHGPSDIQRRQMTTVNAPNVHALAVEGTFDDCQAIVKELLGDPALVAEYRLAAVNSVNWLRVLAQMVYYVVAAVKMGIRQPVNFVVPSGNFGNAYAAYAARRCGLPIGRIIVASNRNDVLSRFFSTGNLAPRKVELSLSPSMDIQLSSNLERLLFELCARDGGKVQSMLSELRDKGETAPTAAQLAEAQAVFSTASASDEETLATIVSAHRDSGIIIDPHTAVGVAVARKLEKTLDGPIVCLACAHPAKFPETIRKAIGHDISLPAELAGLANKPERTALLPAQTDKVLSYIKEHRRS